MNPMIIGLDVGGTHTDVVLLGNEGLIQEAKLPTDHTDLFSTVFNGLETILENADVDQIDWVVLSTTLTTNAIVQQTIDPVGMIVSAGPGIDPAVFKTNDHYYTVSGSLDHRGREVAPLDPDQIQEVAQKLEADGISIVGVVGKFSARNPVHEFQIKKILGKSFETVFLGHKISGVLNFPRRIATTFLNASVYPAHRRFFEAVDKSIRQKWSHIPIHVLKADGGTMSLKASMAYPAQTILSGPAASVMGAVGFAPPDEDALVLDIGGTTTDIAVFVNQSPVLNPLGIRLGRYKTLIRAMETRSIGVGGDSAIKVENGQIKIGPERKGPPMGMGGNVPTPMDALICLNKAKIGNKDKAEKGMAILAGELDISLPQAAQAVLDKACIMILDAVDRMIDRINAKPVYTISELQEGHKVDPKTIYILGGPAPLFAPRLERLSRFKVGIVPRWSVANAIGAALARTTCEVSLFADTQLGILAAPEEGFSEKVDRSFTLDAAVEKAGDLLFKKAMDRGADAQYFKMEVLEALEFNMVRGFSTTGKNIRVRVQVQPGVIAKYDELLEKLLHGL